MMGRHRVLVIGVGSIGERHLRCFGHTGRTQLSFCEIDDELRATIRQRYDIKHDYASLDKALADDHDAAVICTPAHLHIPIAHQLADRGIHLFIEKPLSTSLDDIDMLKVKIQQRNVMTAVGYVLRGLPAIGAMKAAIAAGRIGAPKQIVAVGGQHFPTFRPAYRQIYYTRRETGGGAIQDAITHLLNLGEYLVGPIDKLAADADHLVLQGVEVEDTVHVITRHGPVMGCYSLNQFQAPNTTTITVNGDRGTAEINVTENRWRWMDKVNGSWQDQPLAPLERDDLFVAQAEAFLDVVEGKAQPRCSLDDGLQTLKVNLAALHAADHHTWQTIDQ